MRVNCEYALHSRKRILEGKQHLYRLAKDFAREPASAQITDRSYENLSCVTTVMHI